MAFWDELRVWVGAEQNRSLQVVDADQTSKLGVYVKRCTGPLFSVVSLVCLMFGAAACGASGTVLAAGSEAAQVKGSKAPPPLVVVTSSLPPVVEQGAYAAPVTAKGGTSTYTWSIQDGSLPAGLELSAQTGQITGTASKPGNSTFTVGVTDKGKPVQTAQQRLSITVVARLAIAVPAAAPVAISGSSYMESLQATGGTPNYQWGVASGVLPAGLALDPATGRIWGVPTTSGTSSFTVMVTDQGWPAQSATKVVSITSEARLAIASSTMSSGVAGTAYAATMQANGGNPGYTWAITSGSLPAGVSLAPATGVITGMPTGAGTATFTATVTDQTTPAQSASQTFSVTVMEPLAIASSALSSGTSGTAYAAQMHATGGTPAYAWSIASGSLPAGVSLATTTGVLSGTPTTSGTFNFTVKVSDNGDPAQAKSLARSISVAEAAAPVTAGTTWYVRPDGGTRYSPRVPLGQCDGLADTAYSGVGTNQHCAFNDVRSMWMDGTYGNSAWVMAGGDTLVVRGCAAGVGQENADAPHCRIGKDDAIGGGACQGVDAFWGCSMPPPPSGTAGQHTRILGGCAFGTYSCNPVTSYPYTDNNLTQLFGGFATNGVIYLNGSKYVDLMGLEITSHNGQCTRYGAPAYPAYCKTDSPANDYANSGIVTNNTTANILLQDLYLHGLTTVGINGPIGGAFTLTRVNISFNAFAGWNFDDGGPTPDAPGSSITQSYVTMIGNGCLEEYPIVHAKFPAKACWDSNSAGFGDSWSGQDTQLDSFTCDHCVIEYNTKDAAMGPHTRMKNLRMTNSTSLGNMGQQEKWGMQAGSTAVFENNLIIGNCNRMSEKLPGAAQSFNQSTGLPGAYLTNFCRAAGDVFSFFADANSTVRIANNTIVAESATIFDLTCATPGACVSSPYVFMNNIYLGYTPRASDVLNGSVPGLYYRGDASVVITASHNVEYGVRNGSCQNGTAIICSDPRLVNEPVQELLSEETTLDNFNFHPAPGSPAIQAGASYSGALGTDYYGIQQIGSITIGAVMPEGNEVANGALTATR